MQPALFIAHGAPTLAVENNGYTRFLNVLGRSMKRPKAVILFSAHWESSIQKVSRVKSYQTIHDFGGFPNKLYEIQYPAKGSPAITEEIERLLKESQVCFQIDEERGLDHGAWVVLRVLFPDAEVPVVAMSVNPNLTPENQYRIGQALSELRKKDVLIIGSGGTVHNLSMVNLRKDEGDTDEWAIEFDEWLAQQVERWDLDSLFHYGLQAPHASLAVPPYGKEHFIPLFYAMGASDDSRKAELLHRNYQFGNLSHSVWRFGEDS